MPQVDKYRRPFHYTGVRRLGVSSERYLRAEGRVGTESRGRKSVHLLSRVSVPLRGISPTSFVSVSVRKARSLTFARGEKELPLGFLSLTFNLDILPFGCFHT